jgi:hypothetical protein
VSKKDSSSWKAWGEYRKERSRLKDFRNYKQEALEDREVNEIYVIVNEWTDEMNFDGTEIAGGVYYDSEDDAWEDLEVIARESYGIELPAEENSFKVENRKNIQYEEYRIEVLNRAKQ